MCHVVPRRTGDAVVHRWLRAAGWAACALAAALATAALAPSVARACSCAPDPILRAQPEDAAADVAVDVAPVIEGHFEPGMVDVEREGGPAPQFELSAAPGFDPCTGMLGELLFADPLEENTTYVIRARDPQGMEPESVVRFTTGSGSIREQPLVAPEVSLSFVRGNLIMDSCTSDVRGCLTVHGEQEAEVVITRAGRTIRWAFARGTLTIDDLDEGEPDCVRVRARDAAGRRSAAATERCRGDYPIRDTMQSDYRSYELRCEEGVIGDGNPEPEPEPEPEPSDDAGSSDSGADASAGDPGPARDAGASRRSELDMSGGGCRAAASTARSPLGTGALLLALLVLLRLRRRARPRP